MKPSYRKNLIPSPYTPPQWSDKLWHNCGYSFNHNHRITGCQPNHATLDLSLFTQLMHETGLRRLFPSWLPLRLREKFSWSRRPKQSQHMQNYRERGIFLSRTAVLGTPEAFLPHSTFHASPMNLTMAFLKISPRRERKSLRCILLQRVVAITSTVVSFRDKND